MKLPTREERLTNGYDVFSICGSSYVPNGTLCIEKVDDLDILKDDDEAVRLAEDAGFICNEYHEVIGLDFGDHSHIWRVREFKLNSARS